MCLKEELQFIVKKDESKELFLWEECGWFQKMRRNRKIREESVKLGRIRNDCGLSESTIQVGVMDSSTTWENFSKFNPYSPKDAIYNWEHMKTYVKTTARNFKLQDTLKAIDFAVNAHEGQTLLMELRFIAYLR